MIAVVVACISSLRSLFTQDAARVPIHHKGSGKQRRPADAWLVTTIGGHSNHYSRDNDIEDATDNVPLKMELMEMPFDYGHLLKANP